MKKKSIRAYIGLGSNLNNPYQQIYLAIKELSKINQTQLFKCSSLYTSLPLGPITEQPNFINAVVSLDTLLSPQQLLKELQKIELNHNRIRSTHWGPRTLDLDLLLYGKISLTTPSLKLPHPEFTKRDFVLYPLVEIEPNLQLECGKLIKDLAPLCADNRLRIIDRYPKFYVITNKHFRVASSKKSS